MIRRTTLTALLIALLIPASLFAGFADSEVFLPISGRASGGFGSEFYTTLWITNPSTVDTVDIQIQFLIRNQPNLSPDSFADNLGPGETKMYENFTETLFQRPQVLGAVRITGSGKVLAGARIYNQFPGTLPRDSQGLFFSGVPASFALAPGEKTTVQGVIENDEFRFNFFMLETTGSEVTLSVDVRDEEGALLGGKDYTLRGYEQQFFNVTDIIPAGGLDNARLDITVRSGEGRVMVAGSQATNSETNQDGTGLEMLFPERINADPNSPSITQIIAGPGLTGGGSSGPVTLSIADSGILGSMISAGQTVRSVNGVTDDVVLAEGSNVSISENGNTITISASGGGGSAGVTSLNGLDGSLSITAGSNVTVTPSGSSIQIAATDTQLQLPYNATGSLGGNNALFQIANSGGAALGGKTSATGGSLPAFAVAGGHSNGKAAGGIGSEKYGAGGTYLVSGFSSINFGLLGGVNFGVFGWNVASGSANVGTLGRNTGTNGVGVFGENRSSGGIGVWGQDEAAAGGSLAGYFEGDVTVTGTLAKSSSIVVMDHPLDPANKFLQQPVVQSSEMKSVYDGVVTLDTTGEASVDLPDWVEALNGDFRYQLTCIGGYAPVYIAEKIADNRFRIAGGHPGLEVSWQVTGIRKDPYAIAHPIPVELEKTSEQRGRYIHPELYGMPRDTALSPEGPGEGIVEQIGGLKKEN